MVSDFKSYCFLVPLAGVEPARYRYRWILSPLRLPIPSQRHEAIFIILDCAKKSKTFFPNKTARFAARMVRRLNASKTHKNIWKNL